MLLSNRVAIITGGAKGIGRGTAIKFAEEGCDIAIVDISMKEANETLNEVIKKGREGLAIECDITDGSKVRDTINKVISKFGKIDILVNNAGAGSAGGGRTSPLISVADYTEEEWDKVVSLNLKGTFLCCKEVVPHMKEKGYGKIINVSSLGWVTPPAISPAYHAAKAGVIGLTNDLACGLALHNICVNAILPGPIRTPFYDGMLASRTDEEKDAFWEAVGKGVPLGRAGTPEDMAKAILFFASELSSWITGASLVVSGGLPMRSGSAFPMASKGQDFN